MKNFLDKYNTVIFDMDGVITSEENYWSSAALVVREVLTSDKYFGSGNIDTAAMSADVANIRREVFANDRLITALKGRGVNSNWDLGYVTVLIALILNADDPEGILGYVRTMSDNILDDYDRLAAEAAGSQGLAPEYTARNGELWCAMRDCFQEWFLGDDLFAETFGKQAVNGGKPGLIKGEQPIIPMDSLLAMLTGLSGTKRVCTGTGRPYNELIAPLEAWGITELFAPDGLSNYDHVAAAEAATGQTLTKPHPYMFLKALYGTDYDDLRLVNGDYDGSKIKKALVVGDAGADILAAHAMGADFCAVLTGVQGTAARGYFEKLGAEYILNSAAELI